MEYGKTLFDPYVIPGLSERSDFWKVRAEEIIDICEKAQKPSRKEIICRTPLGYPVYALFYGDFTEDAPQSNWSAGSNSKNYRSYYGDRRDGKQTFLFIAGVHGAEAESVAAAVNLIEMLENGCDFRKKSDPELLELISAYRFIIVPCVNMDGRALSPDHLRGAHWSDFRKASQGWWKDGELVGWRGSKSYFPLPLSEVCYPGGYPNSEGYNIMHDACPGNLKTAEAAALMKLAERWRVDAVLNSHSCEMAPSIVGVGFNTPENEERELDIRFEINRLLHEEGLNAEEIPRGEANSRFDLNTMLSLASGAVVLTLECTVSWDHAYADDEEAPEPRSFEALMQPPFTALRGYLREGLKKPFVIRGTEEILPD